MKYCSVCNKKNVFLKKFEYYSKPKGETDFGIKRSILQRLVAHGCQVEIVPSTVELSTILELAPEGVFFSNGPGDPAAVAEGILLAREIIDQTLLCFLIVNYCLIV